MMKSRSLIWLKATCCSRLPTLQCCFLSGTTFSLLNRSLLSLPHPCSSACLIPENPTDTFDGQHPLQASSNDYLQIPPSISHKPDLALYPYQYCQALMRRNFFLLPVSANKPENFMCTSKMTLAAASASILMPVKSSFKIIILENRGCYKLVRTPPIIIMGSLFSNPSAFWTRSGSRWANTRHPFTGELWFLP